MTSWAVPGAKCVCISNERWWGKYELPQVGRVYTIKFVEKDINGDVGINVEEIAEQNSALGEGVILFQLTHFRPLVPRKTDISVFKVMLTPAGRIPVDA